MAAPQASAAAPGMCGKSYAILIQGADTSLVTADGSSTLPGATTGAVGVGEVTFGAGSGTSCAITTGELIYNAGDIQSNPIGVSFGPSACLAALSGFNGVPCFDGLVDMTGTLSTGGPTGAYILSFVANYDYFDTVVGAGTVPFGFFIQNTLGSAIALGSSIPEPGLVSSSFPGNGAPVLSITMEKQAAAMPSINFGTAPFLGSNALLCTGYGANTTDGIAAAQTAPSATTGQTVAGSYGATSGSYVIFNAAQADGELSFNNNNSYVFPSTGPNPNNQMCPFALVPQNYVPGYTGPGASLFTNGASNLVASLTGTFAGNPFCESLTTAGAGYSDSSVQWGSTDKNAYVIVTGLVGSSTGFVPAGESASCTSLTQASTPGKITDATTASITAMHTTKYGTVTVTNPDEAACDIEVTMTTTSSGSGTAACTLSLVGGSPLTTAAVGPAAVQTVAQTQCTCGSAALSTTSTTSTLTVASTACALSSTLSPPSTYTVTCKE